MRPKHLLKDKMPALLVPSQLQRSLNLKVHREKSREGLPGADND
jgi:hypothetical protein